MPKTKFKYCDVCKSYKFHSIEGTTKRGDSKPREDKCMGHKEKEDNKK